MKYDEVILAHEKHGVFVYASAKYLLGERLSDGYWYDGEDAQEAQDAHENGERASWDFRDSRSDYEYEHVESVTVRGYDA
jgi:hypothetical protein